MLTTKFGRKGSQAINMFISIAGAANFIGAYQYSSPGMDYVIMTSSWLYNSCCKDQPADDVTIKIHKKACFTVARILLGIFSGFATGVCPMYIIELASKKDRGWIGVLNQLMITIGILGKLWLIVCVVALQSKLQFLKHKFSWTNYCTSKYYG